MANKGGYNYTFVEEPSEDFKCPICLLVLRNPHLTGCCGRNFCESCIQSIRERSSQCPLCRRVNFQSMRDLKEERKILSLKVYCTNRKGGCTWKGTVKEIDDHLRPSEIKGECRYEFLLCPYKCGRKPKRCDMKNHVNKECSQRPYTCKYCTYSATYLEVTRVHYVECVKYPVSCPNGCREECNIPRGEVSRHLTECHLQVIPCPFKEQGCGEECTRYKLSQHLDDKVHKHLSLVTSQLNKVVQRVDKLETELQKQKTLNRLHWSCDYEAHTFQLYPHLAKGIRFYDRGALQEIPGTQLKGLLVCAVDMESGFLVRPLDYVTHVDSTPVTKLARRYNPTLCDIVRQKTGKSFQVDICCNKKFLPQFEAFREEMLGYEFLVDGTEYVIMGATAQKEALQSQNVESFLGIKLFPRWTNMVASVNLDGIGRALGLRSHNTIHVVIIVTKDNHQIVYCTQSENVTLAVKKAMPNKHLPEECVLLLVIS